MGGVKVSQICFCFREFFKVSATCIFFLSFSFLSEMGKIT